jgi:hypothetical protein
MIIMPASNLKAEMRDAQVFFINGESNLRDFIGMWKGMGRNRQYHIIPEWASEPTGF